MSDLSLHRHEARTWFVRLQDPEASEGDWLAFLDWIEAASGHREAYDEVERAWTEIESLPRNAAPLVRPVAANDDGARAGRRSRRWLAPLAAAAAVLAVTAGVWPMLSAPDMVAYQTGDSAETVTLADGSTVWLNRQSRIETRIGGKRRDVVLENGEAAFDVIHDVDRPFTVKAGERRVAVLGTAFDVIHQGPRFVVQVTRGAVAVTPAGGSHQVRLTVGQRLRQSGAGEIDLTSVDPEATSSRRDGVLVYRDASLGEVVDDLSLYMNKPVIADEATRNLRFSGVLRADDEVAVLEQLEAFAPVRIDRTSTEARVSVRVD